MNLIIKTGDIGRLHQHPTGLFSTHLTEMMEPLKKSFGIKHFGCGRLFGPGEYSYLTTHPEQAEDFITHEFYKIGFVGDLSEYQTGYYLSDSLPPNQIFNFVRDRYDLDHFLVVIRKYKDYCESFHFGTSSVNTGMSNTYLNHLPAFNAFIDDFKKRAADLIQVADASKIQYPAIHCQETLFTKHFDRPSIACSFPHLFTKKERECAFYLSQCLSLREVSEQVGISPRTLEKHVAKLKYKLGCKNITSLSVALQKYF